jgi:hypothetical protein
MARIPSTRFERSIFLLEGRTILVVGGDAPVQLF